MKRVRMTGIIAALMLLTVCAMPDIARADVLPKEDPGIYVTYTEKEGWDSNFYGLQEVMDQTISQMQPGDEAVFRVKCTNDFKETTKWYMENNVLYSLEDRSANKATYGGAYSYILNYIRPDGTTRPLFASDTIGGEDSPAGEEFSGLKEATLDLGDWLYLGDLAKGETGYVELRVLLEGETQGNSYQDTLADLQMRFSVEKTGKTTTTPTPGRPGKSVPTGDPNNIWPYVAVAAAAAVCLIIFAVLNIKKRKKADGSKEYDEKE